MGHERGKQVLRLQQAVGRRHIRIKACRRRNSLHHEAQQEAVEREANGKADDDGQDVAEDRIHGKLSITPR